MLNRNNIYRHYYIKQQRFATRQSVDISEVEVYAQYNLKMAPMDRFVPGKVENIVEDEENCGSHLFSPRPQISRISQFTKSLKTRGYIVRHE